MLNQYSVYPFHVEVTNARTLVENLGHLFDESKTLRVCYPKLDSVYRNTEEIENNLRKAQSMIDMCLRSLDTIPPVLLKSPCHFWEGVRDIWIPWAFREFAEGRFPVTNSLDEHPVATPSCALDIGLVNNVMLTPMRIIYPWGEYLERENKKRTERIKAAFNAALYD